MVQKSQAEIDQANAEFWNALCGSHLAKMLGVVDNSPESLKKFDDWFFDFYPYLLTHVPADRLAGRKVIEIGLGYGTLSQRLAEAGADYLGMDIAPGPVVMVEHRLRQNGLSGQAVQRSFLDNGLPDASFDAVVAIGCFHHTGDLQRCLDETWRILKPGGTAHLMVYNRYSHRRWMQERKQFLTERALESIGLLKQTRARERERADNDTDLDGNAAPETVFSSVREMRSRLRRFSDVRIDQENMDESDDPKWERPKVLGTWGKRMGLDLYIQARK